MKNASKFMFLLSVILLVGLSVHAQNENKVEMIKLNDHVYKFVCHVGQFNSNVLVLKGLDGFLMVDCAYQQTAGMLEDEIDKLDLGSVKYLILTHSHGDHTGALPVFGKDAEVIAQKNLRKDLTTGYSITLDLPEEVLPAIEIENSYTLQFDGQEIMIEHYPGNHTDNDLVVYFPEEKIVCLGGLLYADSFPFISLAGGGSVQQFIKTYEHIIATFPADTRFIASHGRDYNMEDIKNYHAMLVQTSELIRKGLDKGMDIPGMQEEKILDDKWSSWSELYVSRDLWIQTVANSLAGTIPATVSKTLVLEPLFNLVKEKNAAAAIEKYHELKENYPDEYDFGENNLNQLGYYLLGKNRIKEAIEIFKLNVEIFPESFNVYDSLGEGYMNDEQVDLAIENYERSIELNPENINGIEILKKLKGEE